MQIWNGMKSHALICLLVCLNISLYAQVPAHRYRKGSSFPAVQREVVDILFKPGSLPTGNPFDLHFGAVIAGPGNRTMQVPGFYQGEGEWIVRFSPPEPGSWTFRTYSETAALSGHAGVIEAAPSQRKGGMRIDPEAPERFIYEDGSTCFALAYELDWLFALDYGNGTGIPRTGQIIGDIAKNGFNQVVMNVYAYDVNWYRDQVPAEYEFGKPGYSVFGGTNEAPDFSTLNTALFRHLDRVIAHLDRLDITAHLMIYVWNKNVNWPDMYSVADNRYFDHVITRYQAFSNIVWDVSKEALDYGRCDIPYINERIARIRRMDAYQRLVTVHDYEYCSREPDRVDFISIQSWRSHLYSLMLEATARHRGKPVMNIEHGGYEAGPYRTFEGNYTDAGTCLIRNYLNAFAGVYPTYYWQNTAWNIVIYDALEEGKEFQAPRYEYYRHMAGFFGRYDFNKLYTVPQKITTNSKTGPDNLGTGGYALSNGSDLFLYLVPAENHQVNTVLPEPPGGTMQITWFNPLTGEYREGSAEKWSMWKSLRSPWAGAWSIAAVSLK
jgi:hypothetical protein